jgi:hypothetical protein
MGTSQPTAAHGMMREGAPKPERVRWQPKPERRVLKLAAKMASAARRQFADRATRRVLVLDRTVIAEMATRTKKQQRRKAKALAKFMGRTKAGGATFVSQHVRL